MSHFRKVVPLSVLIIVGFVSLFPSQVEAVTLDKSYYVVNEPIMVTDIIAGENKYIYMIVFDLVNGG